MNIAGTRVTALVLASTIAAVAPAVASPIVDVTPANMNGWNVQTSSTASVAFVPGPLVPPLGVGSAQLSVGADGNSGAQLRTPSFGGIPLSSITTLSYSTFTQVDTTAPPIGDQTIYIILNVDRNPANGTGSADDLLFFEPEYQHGYGFPLDQGDNVLGVWQNWDALAGGWYSLNGFGASGPGTNVKSFATVAGDAVLTTGGTGSVRLVAGFGAGAWDNFVGNVDNFHIHCTACPAGAQFNFDPVVAAAVPEPATSALILSGLALLGLGARRRKASRA